MTYTAFPHKHEVRQYGYLRVWFSHPPERFSDSTLSAARRSIAKDATNRLCNRLCRRIPGHSEIEMAVKLAAISTLTNAHGKNVHEVATAIRGWLKRRRISMERFLDVGTREDAASLMAAVKRRTRRRSDSLVSKYLAYHGNGKWMIYDSLVRAYVYAMWQGPAHLKLAAVREQQGESTYVPRSQRELQSYEKYCRAVDSLWEVFGVAAPKSARMREAVLWHRAKACDLWYDWPL